MIRLSATTTITTVITTLEASSEQPEPTYTSKSDIAIVKSIEMPKQMNKRTVGNSHNTEANKQPRTSTTSNNLAPVDRSSSSDGYSSSPACRSTRQTSAQSSTVQRLTSNTSSYTPAAARANSSVSSSPALSVLRTGGMPIEDVSGKNRSGVLSFSSLRRKNGWLMSMTSRGCARGRTLLPQSIAYC